MSKNATPRRTESESMSDGLMSPTVSVDCLRHPMFGQTLATVLNRGVVRASGPTCNQAGSVRVRVLPDLSEARNAAGWRDAATTVVIGAADASDLWIEWVVRRRPLGLLTTGDSQACVDEAVRAAADGMHFIGGSLCGRVRVHKGQMTFRCESPLCRLSDVELEVLELLVIGESLVSTAGRLSLTERAVETHRSRITRKLNVRDRAALARLAMQAGLMAG